MCVALAALGGRCMVMVIIWPRRNVDPPDKFIEEDSHHHIEKHDRVDQEITHEEKSHVRLSLAPAATLQSKQATRDARRP